MYQEERDGTLVPVDHIDRALSTTEQGQGSQLEWESLAKSWGMNMLRTYLVGKKFTSSGDHLPLVPLYNNPTVAAGRRVSKHRQQVQDLHFTDKYLKGKQNPCDYKSRHPSPIDDLSMSDRKKMGMDDTDEITVMLLWVEDMPQ